MKRKRPLPKKRTLWFFAEGEISDGTIKRFSVYREGRSIEIVGPNLYRHPCHPSRKDREGVEREITVVFDVNVRRIKYPGELEWTDCAPD